MKIRRTTKLGSALDEIASAVQSLKSGATEIEGIPLEINGSSVGIEDDVELEIEFEVDAGRAELEFEIKWPASPRAAEQAID